MTFPGLRAPSKAQPHAGPPGCEAGSLGGQGVLVVLSDSWSSVDRAVNKRPGIGAAPASEPRLFSRHRNGSDARQESRGRETALIRREPAAHSVAAVVEGRREEKRKVATDAATRHGWDAATWVDFLFKLH